MIIGGPSTVKLRSEEEWESACRVDSFTCGSCKEYKDREEFYPSDLENYKRICIACRNRNNARSFSRRYKVQRGRYLAIGARSRARHRNLAYDLDEHLDDIQARAVGCCELTGIPFKQEGGKTSWNSPSIDRIKPELGYVHSNIRLVLHCLNMAMGDWGEGIFTEVASAFLEKRNEPA